MIEGVLDELVHEVEDTEAQGDVEEEGSSSTPNKEDIEDKHTTNENQIISVPSEKVESQQVEPGRQEPIEVEESVPHRGLKEETVIDDRG